MSNSGSKILGGAVGGAFIGGIYGLISEGKDALTCAFDGALIGTAVGAVVALATSGNEESDESGFFGLLSGDRSGGFSSGGEALSISSSRSVGSLF